MTPRSHSSPSQDFDWYISPAERFSAETQFAKYSQDEDEVALSQLGPLFQLSRLSEHEFSQIWQLVDIRMAQRINLEQFVYFSHILNTRRKGKPLPHGIPLDVKGAFLKEPVAVPAASIRPSVSTRDIGSHSSLPLSTLTSELAQLTSDLARSKREEELARDHLAETVLAKEEGEALVEYKRREVAAGGGTGTGTGTAHETRMLEDLVGRLRAERDLLQRRQAELRRGVESL
ncbi:uncharacterized protein EV422DRAFT_511544 [Fimicolochytrium jonesii]|uniref:uncharacterized protein n=1 Tax=Fimicolochytrium jonesii TaxID=1396493 RepID=UPI0022FF00A3|nr:uncharacterized protein EV422DRAFT_511544 [Fimicolochytrium jonesii]KAI8826821.1 hypothetical protein EV422DRAFT_511544 [Fimicolochytrium jonesii]